MTNKNQENSSESIKITNGEFGKALENVKVPLLPLDQKWHHLFMGIEKNDKVIEYEQKVDDLLKLQGRLNTDLKGLKKVKKNLMSEIVDNMDDSEASNKSARDKKMEDNRRLIDEVNEKMADIEDQLLDLPKDLDEANKLLMIYSMDQCYRVLRDNAEKIEEIGTWIRNMKKELKKNIIIKQADEAKNQEIYSYMHALLGPKVIDVFDLKYDEDGEVLDTEESKDKKDS